MSVISFENLSEIRQRHNSEKIIYCSGSFDLTHAGHVLFFDACKRLGNILVVGVGSDAAVKKLKGPTRPILNEHLRIKMVSSLKSVDYCFLDPHSPNAPLDMLRNIFVALKPDFYAVNNDAFDIETRRNTAQKCGVLFVILERTCPEEFKNISATEIIEKIKSTLR